MEKFCSEVFNTTVGDVDILYRLTPYAILDYFQTIATRHAKQLKVSREDLLKQGCYWVVNRCAYRQVLPIGLHEKITVKTWVSSVKIAYSDREYLISNARGEDAIYGTSRWCLLNVGKNDLRQMREVMPIESIVEQKYLSLSRRSDDGGQLWKTADFKILPSDIDVNMHLNNAKYANLFYDTMDLATHLGFDVGEFEVTFLRQVQPYETIKVNIFKGSQLYVKGESLGELAFEARAVLNSRG